MSFDRLFADVPAVVAVPVRDEAERIGDCLLALDGQGEGPAPGILLLVNNTTDATVPRVAELAPSLRCPVRVVQREYAPGWAHAGQARRDAMQEADDRAPAGVPLLTTDADGQVEPGWLRANLRHLARGAQAVFGQAVIDPAEAHAIPPALHEADAREVAYAALLDEIEWLLDPDPVDPWPRHTEHSGASIAVTREVFRAVGGVPAVALGEDRAFAAALRRADARIVHATDARVVVSGRILGRAAGGMADTIRRRLAAPDMALDEALEPVLDRVRRMKRRRAARAAHAGGAEPFGAVWERLDAACPMSRVPVAGLADEMAAALAVRDGLLGATMAVRAL